MKIVITILVSLVVLGVGGMWYLGQQSRELAPAMGLVQGQLADCPDSPNCVSSSASGDHAYPALTLRPGTSWDKIVAEVSAMDGVQVIKDDGAGYLQATFRSPTFGFVDDVELHLNDATLGVRSASRVGHSDMDANRKRMDALSQRLAAAGLLAG